jgi:hypothetical protein
MKYKRTKKMLQRKSDSAQALPLIFMQNNENF